MADEEIADSTEPPLKGVVVADFSRVLAGPLATMMLGDLGAEIIKIERPEQGDETRSWGPPHTEDGTSAYYLSVNRNKRSITVDLRDEAQRAHARSIAECADVVIENFRAGTMQKFGLDYAALRRRNPGLVYCRISGFGSKAGRDLPGYDFLIQALSGLMSITGEPEGPPMKTGVAIVDVLAGLHATIGIMAALHERQQSQLGQMVEVNLFSSALASLVNQASSFLTAGVIPTRISNQHPSIAPYETFATSSQPIIIAVGNDRQFRRLCRAIDAEEIADNTLWSTNSNRVENRAALKAELERRLTKQPDDHWLQTLKENDVPCGPINNIGEAFELARNLGLDAVQDVEKANGETVATVSNPIAFSRSALSYRCAPPALGADTDAVLQWLKDKQEFSV